MISEKYSSIGEETAPMKAASLTASPDQAAAVLFAAQCFALCRVGDTESDRALWARQNTTGSN
jgi:hypothetical protein